MPEAQGAADRPVYTGDGLCHLERALGWTHCGLAAIGGLDHIEVGEWAVCGQCATASGLRLSFAGDASPS